MVIHSTYTMCEAIHHITTQTFLSEVINYGENNPAHKIYPSLLYTEGWKFNFYFLPLEKITIKKIIDVILTEC